MLCSLIFVLLVEFSLICFFVRPKSFRKKINRLEIVLILSNARLVSQVNNTAVIFFNRQFLTFSYYFDKVLLCFCKRSKTPSDNTCLGEPPESFYVVGFCCCFASLEVFHSLLCFSASSFILLEAIAGFLHPFYAFSPVNRRVIRNTFTLTFLGFSITILLRALQFWAGVFYRQTFFTLNSFPTFWHVFVTSMRAGTPYPGSSSVPPLTELSIPADAWSWITHIIDARPFVYQLRQWDAKHRVKTLRNMFQPTYACSKLYGKTIKTLWIRLVNKYCLKLLQRNCFLIMHRS